MKIKNTLGEFDLIYNYLVKLSNSNESYSFKDDAAVFTAGTNKIVVSVDSLVENRHFFSGDEPQSIATKLLETNLSDIAAMGATPKYWTLALSIPKDRPLTKDWVIKFCEVLAKIQKENNFYLLGGDTSITSGVLTLSANIFGFIENTKKPLHKFNAKANDVICVSNYIGDYYFGFKLLEQNIIKNSEYKFLQDLSKEDQDYLIAKYKYPKAQVELGKIILNYANAATDVSDGLWIDVEKLCTFSNKLGYLYLDKLVFSSAVNNIIKMKKFSKEKIYKSAITGGGDYQLAFTINEEKLRELKIALLGKDIFIQEIGKITDLGMGLNVFSKNNKIISSKYKGFEHNFT